MKTKEFLLFMSKSADYIYEILLARWKYERKNFITKTIMIHVYCQLIPATSFEEAKKL